MLKVVTTVSLIFIFTNINIFIILIIIIVVKIPQWQLGVSGRSPSLSEVYDIN